MARKRKVYERVKRDMFHREDPRQDFVYPRILVKSVKYPDCWKMKYGSRKYFHPVRYDGEIWSPSRLSYHLNVKNIPRTTSKLHPGKGCVCHTCKNTWCVNPRHLFLTDRYDPEEIEARRNRVKTKPYSGRKPAPNRRLGYKPNRKHKPDRVTINQAIATHFWLLKKYTVYWGA
jgi:hypothetical protein